MVEVEVWVIVDGAGNWEIGSDPENVAERWSENVGDGADEPRRMVKVKLLVPRPEVMTVSATVPAEPSPGDVVVSFS